MKNHELGYKSSFANGKGRLNLTYYHMAWEEYQLQTRDPSFVDCIDPETGEPVPPENQGGISIPHECGQPWQTLIANLGEASIDGFNVSVDYSPNENWVFGFNYENMKAETDSAHDLDADGEDGPGERNAGCRSSRTTKQQGGSSITGRLIGWVLMISSSASSGRLPVTASAGSSRLGLIHRSRNS